MDEAVQLLHKAASCNGIPLVETLLRNTVDVNRVNWEGDNALNIAVANNHIEMVKLLVQNGALLNYKKTRISPLILAMKYNYYELVEILIGLGASVEKGWLEGNKWAPLRFASRCLNFKMVQLLIQKGANVRAIDRKTRRTALHEIGDFVEPITRELNTTVRIKIAKILLKSKADINAKDLNCRTPLDGAIIDNAELSKFFIKEGALVRREMDNGFFVEYVLYVVTLNCPELVVLCLERGGDYTHGAIVDDEVTTAYHKALKKSTPEVVKIFWKFGCPVDLPIVGLYPGMKINRFEVSINPCNFRVFQAQLDFIRGIRQNNLQIVLAAIANGAEPKGTSAEVPSILHHLAATSKGNHKIARYLLRKGVPVNKVDHDIKKTCLYFALINNNFNILKEVLKFGACFTSRDFESLKRVKNKETKTVMQEIKKAFHLTRKGSTKVLKMIKRFKKSGNKDMTKILMNCVDRQGRSLLGLALYKGHVKLAEDLMKLRIQLL